MWGIEVTPAYEQWFLKLDKEAKTTSAPRWSFWPSEARASGVPGSTP